MMKLYLGVELKLTMGYLAKLSQPKTFFPVANTLYWAHGVLIIHTEAAYMKESNNYDLTYGDEGIGKEASRNPCDQTKSNGR
jgi:hypothetical protein